MSDKKIAILYHGGCPDGFGGAYAAWKKFGDDADYIPVHYVKPRPEGLAGKEIYMIDFCYEQATMDELQKDAGSLTVLDHHEGTQQVVESMPHHIYDVNRSGATIAWSYFHPDTPVPTFLQYVEDADLFKKMPDDERAIIKYSYSQGFNFAIWDEIARRVEEPEERAKIIERGRIYAEYFDLLAREFVNAAELVDFEGHTVYLGASEKMFITEVGKQLALKRGPFALIARTGVDGIRVSIRGDGSLDVTKIAQKYGGNGHPSSAAFSLPWGAPLPWKAHQA